MPDQPLLLDLFCGAGGAGEGYARAGFRVVGVDLDPKPLRHNPHEHYLGDALDVLDTLLAGREWQGHRLGHFAAIHASPPCQAYARSRLLQPPARRSHHQRLIPTIRARLTQTRLTWIIENIPDAATHMPDAISLCGTSFALRLQRHRLFSSNILLLAAGPCHHRPGDVSVRRNHAEYNATWTATWYHCSDGIARRRPTNATAAAARAAMGIDWMPLSQLGEAIPPAYTQWLGRQLLAAIPNWSAA